MSTEPDSPPAPADVDLGDGRTALFDEPAPPGMYRVRQPGGEVWLLPARTEATPENALADLVTNPPEPIASAAPVPDELPAWRVKAVADLASLTPAIEAALAALPQPARTVATRAWSEGNVIRRDSATVQSLAAVLGLTEAQVDDMFRQAAAISDP